MTAGPVRDVRKIAVFRPSAVGDFVFCLPALDALRQTYRDAEIVYIGKQWHQDFLEGRPGPVDRVLVLPATPGINAPASGEGVDAAALGSFIDKLRGARFDLALQMYGGGRFANPLLARLGARISVGMRSPEAAPLDRCLDYGGVVNRRLQLLELAALAGARSWPMGPQLAVTAMDRHQAALLVPDTIRPLVLLQPGASDARRRWPAARFAAVGDALAELGALVLVNGAPNEVPLARQVIATMRHQAVDLSGKASLQALCGLLARTALVVSNDTGPLHLALALGRPCVGIYWLSNLVESAPLCQAGHRAAVSLRTACPVCGAQNLTQRCDHDTSFVDDVALDEVAALAIAMLQEARQTVAVQAVLSA